MNFVSVEDQSRSRQHGEMSCIQTVWVPLCVLLQQSTEKSVFVFH